MKSIAIIGASSGIGRKLAEMFAEKGYKVAISARREDRLRQIAERYPEQVTYRAFDVTEPDAVTHFNDLLEACGGVDTVLYCAGVGFANPQMDSAKDTAIIEVNVAGFTRIVNAAYQYFKATANTTRGQIAAITSIAGTKGLGHAPGYSASKSYQQKYLQAVDQLAHIQSVNVDITDIRPGFIRTDLLDPNVAYPLTMAVDYAAPRIMRAILLRRRVAIIDWRWSIITGLWRMIPNCLWPHLKVTV